MDYQRGAHSVAEQERLQAIADQEGELEQELLVLDRELWEHTRGAGSAHKATSQEREREQSLQQQQQGAGDGGNSPAVRHVAWEDRRHVDGRPRPRWTVEDVELEEGQGESSGPEEPSSQARRHRGAGGAGFQGGGIGPHGEHEADGTRRGEWEVEPVGGWRDGAAFTPSQPCSRGGGTPGSRTAAQEGEAHEAEAEERRHALKGLHQRQAEWKADRDAQLESKRLEKEKDTRLYAQAKERQRRQEELCQQRRREKLEEEMAEITQSKELLAARVRPMSPCQRLMTRSMVERSAAFSTDLQIEKGSAMDDLGRAVGEAHSWGAARYLNGSPARSTRHAPSGTE
ncbi:hypothetical protein CYMTET_33237, partial [Cymbomonas tetramitiformis]